MREVLQPCLWAGQVVMDNLALHHWADVRAVIEEVGALWVHLPPYSPDVSPLEWMVAKVKAAMRAVAVRERTAVVDALDWAPGTVTAHVARGYFGDVQSF